MSCNCARLNKAKNHMLNNHRHWVLLLQAGYWKSDVGVTKSNSGCVLEGLDLNLCVVPFLNICVPNWMRGQKLEMVRGGWSWVRGVVRGLDWRGSESKDRSELMDI